MGEKISTRGSPPSSDAVDYRTGSLPGAMTADGLGISSFRFQVFFLGGRRGGVGSSLIDTCQQLAGPDPMRASLT